MRRWLLVCREILEIQSHSLVVLQCFVEANYVLIKLLKHVKLL
jgi:hypothetical protein